MIFLYQERQDYEDSLKVYRDLKNVLDTAELRGLQKGMEKGMEKGMQKGMEKGMKKGRAEGLLEGKKTIARNLKAIGLSPEQIAKVSGMTEEEVDAL